MADYVRDPAEIYAASFAIARAETDLGAFSDDEAAVALRLVHACGMPGIAADLRFSGGAVEAGRAALAGSADVLVDSEMVAAGVTRARLPAANAVRCTLNDRGVRALAERDGTTRSAAAVDYWRDRLAGAVVAVGNAPTALFRLLEILDADAPVPAVVLGFPVGFVGAAESKRALAENTLGIPYITLLGRFGGSALAAAAVNALASDDQGARP